MKPRLGAIIALVSLATCSEETNDSSPATIESARAAIGVSPPSEVATWQRMASASTPDGRYLQSLAYDETRKLVVMFGGEILDPSAYSSAPTNDTWSWNPATGKWALQIPVGAVPNPRLGAAMVFDSKRNKFVLFGGRSGGGYDYEETWELDAATGAWSNVSAAGSHPSARSHHAMVYEKSTGKIFLFGGGRSDLNSYDGTGVTVSLGDAWELDPTTYAWTAVSVAGGPSGRHDMGLAWDSARNKVVLFGGMQSDIATATGAPKQDTWEYDPATGAWTERTALGDKPSARYAHAMAFDGSRGKAVVFGGWDISTGNFMNDLWDWDPGSGAWTQRLGNGNAPGPTGRLYASMIYNAASARLELIAGGNYDSNYGKGGYGGSYIGPVPIGAYGFTGSREVWELEPATAAYTDRTAPLDVPAPRSNHAMAYHPVTGKVYMFGGYQSLSYTVALDDLWEWNGTTWAQVDAPVRPPARADAGLAYDPARKSLILFGGTSYSGSQIFADTWEWTSLGGWKQLSPSGSPDALYGHGMVTDTTRSKILLFGGMSNYYWYYGPDGGIGGAPMKDPMRNDVWEWDGAKLMWTNRTPTTSAQVPAARQYPVMAFDEGRGKLFVFDGLNYSYSTGGSPSSFWEWDTSSAGWAQRDPQDWLNSSYNLLATYDSIRRREIMFTETNNYTGMTNETWEIDARGPIVYVRAPTGSPGPRYNAAMAFDSARDVVVMFGGIANNTGTGTNETWEYKITNWGNGEGCTTAFAAICASGNCVDGVCCDAAACSGPCKSCNVAGSEGTCVPAKAGTEVAGSCANGQACDGKGSCMSSNGQACTAASACASGFCTDGVCCDSVCAGACVSCAIKGQTGKCSPYLAGTDPQTECGKGSGSCRSTCDGVGACVFPSVNQPCASCTVCDGAGTCNVYDPYCQFTGAGGTGGFGGTGGYLTSYGGSGGITTSRGGAGGAGGYVTSYGGSGGITTSRGGSGGTIIGYGGTTTSRGGSGGTIIGYGGSGGTSTSRGGSGGTIIGYGGASGYGGGGTSRGGAIGSGGTSIGYGGSSGSAGSAGKDGGSSKGGSTGTHPDGGTAITLAQLHRSGCSCELGSARRRTLTELGISLLITGVALVRRRQRKR